MPCARPLSSKNGILEGQLLALAFRKKSVTYSKVFLLGSEAVAAQSIFLVVARVA
jgi:hypothetical protein